MDKSKYYYDYTRNMSYEEAEKFKEKKNNALGVKAKPIFSKKNENWTNKIKNGKGTIV
tara:strand:+ start:1962 stop:2135 length:174 start_codon:yes stop_codon:yes gene_type:complete